MDKLNSLHTSTMQRDDESFQSSSPESTTAPAGGASPGNTYKFLRLIYLTIDSLTFLLSLYENLKI